MNRHSNLIELPTTTFGGRYKLTVRGPDGNIKHETDWFDNLITDGGLEALGTATEIAKYCSVGTGNAAPTNADVQLQAFLAHTATVSATSSGIVAGPPRYGYETRSYAFAQGAVIGNVAEVGVGSATSGTSLFSRSLVSPALPLLAIDQLTVTYELRMYVPTSDTTGSVTIGATTYNYTIRALGGATNSDPSFFGWRPNLLGLGATTRAWANYNLGSSRYVAFVYASPAVVDQITDTDLRASIGGAYATRPNPEYPSSVSNAAYVGGTKYCRFTCTWGINNGNCNIRGFKYGAMFGTYGMEIDANIVKDNTKELVMTWQQNWARRP